MIYEAADTDKIQTGQDCITKLTGTKANLSVKT